MMRVVFFVFLMHGCTSTGAKSRSIKINTTQQNVETCSFSFSVKTSCSSPQVTRDHVSLAFGDAYGNKIYIPRVDDVKYKKLERCATDSFDTNAPCTKEICYANLYRSGDDAAGWIPENVIVTPYQKKSLTFNFNSVNIPNGTWYEVNNCLFQN